MDGTQILTLGLGLEAPWILKDQHLDTSVSPHRLDLYVEAERGSLYPCPECGKACPAHDFAEKTWRHLNFFQHHCYLHARVPRTKCPEHGVKRIEVPWARPGSDFTLLFEQAAMSLVKEMPVLAVSRQLEITDKRLWRIVHHYVGRMLGELDLSSVATVGVDETASRRGQRYVTVFLDMQRKQEPVLFAVPGHGKAAITAFSAFLAKQGGDSDNVVEVVCDMSQAFLSGVAEQLPNAEVTVDSMAKALTTLERHAEQVVRRWISGLTNARLEGMNGLIQAARSRARGYRNEANFIAMIYLIGSPVGRLLDQAKST